MPDESTADALQNVAIQDLKATAKEHTGRIGAVEQGVAVITAEIKSQNKLLERVEATTSNYGSSMAAHFTAERGERAKERQADRDAAQAERDTNAAWWGNVFKLTGTVVTLAGGLAAAVWGVGGGHLPAAQAHPTVTTAPIPAPAAGVLPSD